MHLAGNGNTWGLGLDKRYQKIEEKVMIDLWPSQDLVKIGLGINKFDKILFEFALAYKMTHLNDNLQTWRNI